MKVAFSGASGSGKTTLVKWVAEHYNLPHLSGSSGDLKTDDDREYLASRFGVEGREGHAKVIKESHNNPEFGYELQRMILTRRSELIKDNQVFVTDRSPIDNFVYYMLQAGLYQNDGINHDFYEACIQAMIPLDHIFVVPFMFDFVEDNGSRLTSQVYQHMVTHIFSLYHYQFQAEMSRVNSNTKIHLITPLLLDDRKNKIINILG